jgi:ribosomal protein S18 acetylase RimI-like enzyme
MPHIHQTHSEQELDLCEDLMHRSEPFITLQFSIDACKQAVRGDHKEVYIATVEGEFAGFVVIQLYGVLRGYIQTICIAPEHRSKGIGTLLIRHCEERISKISPNVFMCVSSFNDRARKLYYSLGYEKVGELKDHIVKGYDEYLLRKSKGAWRGFVAEG